MKELPKIYDPKTVEKKIYEMWLSGGYFHAQRDPDKKAFTIVIPPPNVTGQLHLGHAFDETIQDVLIRYKRMQGFSALWLPGTDHAGIATQIKVGGEPARGGAYAL
jgi:valyl-tRNA synthetase